MNTISLLPKGKPIFPECELALQEPNGLLAAGGMLNVEWLVEAYTKGIFPWFNSDDEEILWWSPSQRAILYPGEMHVSRSLRKLLKKDLFIPHSIILLPPHAVVIQIKSAGFSNSFEI